MDLPNPDLLIAITPFGVPAAALAAAAGRAGAVSVLDLGADAERARAQLRQLTGWLTEFGVRTGPAGPLAPAELPASVRTVLLSGGDPSAWRAAGRRVLVEVCSVEAGRAAVAAGADGLIARGAEGGGRGGELSTFVLLQRLLAEVAQVPVWAAGGVGRYTAAAAVAGGARGVVLDTQLALTAEGRAALPAQIVAAIAAMDGSETTVIDGYRVLTRPDLPIAELAAAGRYGTDGLHSALLPVGQDGPVAARLAARFTTVAGVLDGVRAAIRSQVAAAAASPALAQGAGLASRDGRLRYPIVQGPMTRVSDRPEFAAEVAAAGGLPMLALALMSGADTHALLTRTARLLSGQPWGVGLLGFNEPELLDAQLAAVAAARPPYAIVAGGRPAQAAGLEAAGVTAFLHVPAPGLLEQFLAAGARRFVFEGFECGGHIGPRASFPLWESQLEVLLAFEAAQPGALAEVDVLFAGGIHDARGAAMVSALAAPLVARGVAVGALVGTAYLFTEEVVRTGAIRPGFQLAALGCERTALLETAPGHVTRCADSPYAAEFVGTATRLAADGIPPQERWAELERLNLGRLRLASRGLRRVGDSLVECDEQTQRQEGMFMLGQVATARRAVTTVPELHAAISDAIGPVLTAAARALADVEPEQALPAAGPLDVAIVGMECVYPGASDGASFWANILAGRDAVTEVPASRWDPERYFAPDGPGTTPSRWGGFLPPVPFDPLAYGIPPSALGAIEPVQLLALHVAAGALRDAGYAPLAGEPAYGARPFDRDRAAVIFGAESGTDLTAAYTLRSSLPAFYDGELPDALDQYLPVLTEDSFPGVLANVIAGRIANRLDLGGANYTVDAACGASLAAVRSACSELTSGSADLVLCGGADLHNSINDYLLFASVHALSPTGRCATFDRDADGIALGEGVGCVVLKRLSDAERDGDRIYAVIKGVGAGSDGRSLGLTAPRPAGQRRALDRAYEQAAISPAGVGLVEAHGTGTAVGDRTELAALTDAFVEAGALPGTAVIGSVKSQIGHTKCAAGLASLIKVARAVHAGVRPGTLHVREPNPYWKPASSPFTFGSRPWAVEPGQRIAGVSGFGFGGTNFHVVMQGYGGADEPAHGLTEWPAEIFAFRTTSGPDVARLEEWLRANDAAGRPWSLRQLAAAQAALVNPASAPGRPIAATAVVSDLDELAAAVSGLRSGATSPGVVTSGVGGRVAFLFPGQGSQRPGMLADLYAAFPPLLTVLRLAGGRHAGVMFPPAAFDRAEAAAQKAALTDTRAAQPALGIAGLTMATLLGALGVRPDLVGGHSYGELVALCVAGAYDQETLLALSTARAEAILDAAGRPEIGQDPGGMAAVVAPADRVLDVLRRAGLAEQVVVANHNAPAQTVVAGPTEAIGRAVTAMADGGLRATTLPVACAFHSPLVASAAGTFGAVLADRELGSLALPVWSNTTAQPYPATDADAIRALLADQVANPVRFVKQIESMYAAGARIFVEAGPGRVLTGLAAAILGDRPHTAVACDVSGDAGVTRLLQALAQLAVAGVPVDLAPLFTGRVTAPAAAELARPPRRPGWTVDGHLVRDTSGHPVRGGLRPATEAPRLAVPETPVPASTVAMTTEVLSMAETAPSRLMGTRPSGQQMVMGAAALPGEAAVMEFLRTSRELVGAQRDVLLGLLGQAGGDAVARLGSVDSAVEPATLPAPRYVEAAPARPSAAPDQATPSADPVAADPVSADPVSVEQPSAVLSAEEIRAAVLATIGERTGYPEDMLDGPLDLEADLSIDSIKRTEIVAELAKRLGATVEGSAPDDSVVEDLTRIKTVDGLAAWFTERLDGPTEPSDAPAEHEQRHGAERPAEADAEPEPVGAALSGGSRPPRRVLDAVQAPIAPAADPGQLLQTHRVALIGDDRGIALALADLLAQHGAQVRMVESAVGAVAGAHTLIDLGALRPGGGPALPTGYAAVRDFLLAGGQRLLLVTGSGGGFGYGHPAHEDEPVEAGLRGLVRTVAREFPAVLARAVDVDAKDDPQRLARLLLAELVSADGEPVVGYREEQRYVPRMRVEELAGEPGRLPLDADSVVLLTGGARGITARAAVALAGASGCHVELIGRTPLPAGPPEAWAAGSTPDPIALRRDVIAQGIRRPAEVEAEVRRRRAELEIRATLAALRDHASSVRYHAVDVTDAAAVRGVVDDVYARHGRLDGVVHGAGVLDDRLIQDKDPDGFARVWATKVGGAMALVAAVRPGLEFLALFGSIAGVVGNRGQADYAAANDALDTLARYWNGQIARRVVAVDWGPWAGAGMVTPELAREYARRGVPLVDPEAGVACLLAELGADGPSQVVYAASDGLDG